MREASKPDCVASGKSLCHSGPISWRLTSITYVCWSLLQGASALYPTFAPQHKQGFQNPHPLFL